MGLCEREKKKRRPIVSFVLCFSLSSFVVVYLYIYSESLIVCDSTKSIIIIVCIKILNILYNYFLMVCTTAKTH